MIRPGWIVVASGALWVCLAGLAHAAMPTKAFTTERWKAKVPADWQLEESCLRGGDKVPSTWTLASPKRNLVFKVQVRPDKGGKMADHAAKSLASLSERVIDPQIVKQDTTNEDGREVFYAVVKGVMKRKTTHRDYLVWRLLARSKSQKALVTLTLASSGERLDQLMDLVASIMATFDFFATPAKAVRK